MKAAGFAVTVTEVDDTSVARKRFGLTERCGSCHAAVVAGYLVAGHVFCSATSKVASASSPTTAESRSSS